MAILTLKSVLESDLSDKDTRVSQCAEATHHLAVTLRNAHAWLWSLPPERLLPILNADVAVTLETFAANTALGTVANGALDAADIPQFATRAPVETGRADLVFDGKQFSIKVPEPEPDPEAKPGDPAPESETASAESSV